MIHFLITRVLPFVAIIAIAFGGWYLYNYIQDLREARDLYEKGYEFDKNAFNAFKQMDGEWTKIELWVTAYYPSTKYPEGGVLNAFNTD